MKPLPFARERANLDAALVVYNAQPNENTWEALQEAKRELARAVDAMPRARINPFAIIGAGAISLARRLTGRRA